MSQRTLQRRLSEEGLNFNELLDTVRRSAAQEYLSGGKTSVDEVAFLVGFAKSSSFFRAFKRWTDMTPEGYRRLAGKRRGDGFVNRSQAQR